MMRTNENIDEEEESPIQQHNKAIVKEYILKAKVTSFFFCLILLVFLVEVFMCWTSKDSSGGLRAISMQVLWKLGGNVPYLVQQGQIYRIITATVLHGGALHWLMNTASLVTFCAQVEAISLTKVYLAVYLVGGVQGNMLFDFKNIKFGTPNTIAIGASTSICAIMGLFIANVIALYLKGRDIKEARRTVCTMLITLLIISMLPGIDFYGHFGSLISGVLLGMMLIPQGDRELKKMKWVGIIGFAIYTLLLLSIWF